MDNKLVKMEASYKDLIDQENSKDSDQNDSDGIGDHDPLVMDLTEALKPIEKQPLLAPNDSETDSCDSEEREMNSKTNNLNQILGEQSIGSNMKQLKNYVNFYKMTRDFEQKFKSLKSKNKSKLYFSMSSLSEVKEAINNPQKEMVGKIHCLKKWMSESNLNICDDLKFKLGDFQHCLISENNLEKVNSLEFISEPPLLPSTKNENSEISEDFEKDPLSTEEDIKPTISDLMDITHPKESPKKGLIKLRNITELVDNESNNKKTSKCLNIPVKFDLKNMKIIGHTSASTSVMSASTNVSSISKTYLCYSDNKEILSDEFNPIIESSYSLAPKTLNTTYQNEPQKLNIPSEEVVYVHDKEIDGIHEINTGLPSIENVFQTSISNQITTSDPAQFSLIPLNTKSDGKTVQRHIFLQKSCNPLNKSPNKNSLLPISSVTSTQKASFINVNDKGLPSFINVLSDSHININRGQKIGVVYPNTQEPIHGPKLLPKKSNSLLTNIANSSATGITQNTPIFVIPNTYNNQTAPKVTTLVNRDSLKIKNPSTYSNKTNFMTHSSSPNETIIGNIKLVKPVSDRVNTLSKDILPFNILPNNSLVNANMNASVLNFKKSPNVTSSSKIMSPLEIPKSKILSKTLSIKVDQSTLTKQITQVSKQTAIQNKNSELLNEPLPNLSTFNVMSTSDQFKSKVEPPEVLLSKKSTVVFSNNQIEETQTGFPTRQSVKLVPTSKPVAPSNATIAKTRLLFRKDIPRKEGRKSARKYICQWCEASFIKDYLCDQHIHRVTCNMVYECIGCSGRRILFRNRCQLLKHLVSHYGSNNNIVINYNKLKVFRLSVNDIFSQSTGKEDVTLSDERLPPLVKSSSHITSPMKQNANSTKCASVSHVTLNQFYKKFQRQKIINDARKKANLQNCSKSDSKPPGHKLNNNIHYSPIPLQNTTTISLKVPLKKSSKLILNTNAVKSNKLENILAGLEWIQKSNSKDIFSTSKAINLAGDQESLSCQEVMVEERLDEKMVQSKSTLKNKEDIASEKSNIKNDETICLVSKKLGNQFNLIKSTSKSIDLRMEQIKRKLPEKSTISDGNPPKKNKMDDTDTSITSNVNNSSTENHDFCSVDKSSTPTKVYSNLKLHTAVEKKEIIENSVLDKDTSHKEENNIISCKTEAPSTLNPLKIIPKCLVCKKHLKNVCYNIRNRPNPKYTCTTYCQAIMSNACTLELHKNLHERKKPFICPSCGIDFTMYKHLSTHMTDICKFSCRTVVSKCLYCDFCVEYPPNSMDDTDPMKLHFIQKHLELLPESDIGSETYRCKVCYKLKIKLGGRHINIGDTNLHFKYHFNNAKTLAYRYKCDGCNRLWPNRIKLLKHSCV